MKQPTKNNNMEFKGTKGKWEREKTFVYALNDLGTNAFSLNVNNDGKTPIEEQEANAKLIAVAPELLNCLIDALTGMEWRHDNEPETLDKSDYEKMDEWREIIKKATE